MPRVLAVDWGERRIGLAISDPRGVIATGLATLTIQDADQGVARVAQVAREEEAECIVVGLPLLMSGERGEAAEAAAAFAKRLATRTRLPVDTYDERLTTALSERRLRELGIRTGHARERVDQGAAVALLESYLQHLAARAPSESDAEPES